MNLSRRGLLCAAVAWASSVRAADAQQARDAARSSHFPFGPVVPPRRVEAWPMVTQANRSADMLSLLRGKVSAVQLMFTGCTATCPIQGALFAQAQALLRAPPGAVQWLSISIDPLGDTPAALQAWLKQFGAGPAWLAALPRVADVEAIIERMGSGGEKRPAGPDPHTGQVYLFDRRAELVLRTPSMPPAAQIVEAVRAVAARA
jgi:protein SCO1/2